mmetsp:Transcript_18324/g.51825  ORF Transcript_18324/g.51825 Transcript_18324/m.51825 type:complete len:216 (+) Transcript_18324:323-970(+)
MVAQSVGARKTGSDHACARCGWSKAFACSAIVPMRIPWRSCTVRVGGAATRSGLRKAFLLARPSRDLLSLQGAERWTRRTTRVAPPEVPWRLQRALPMMWLCLAQMPRTARRHPLPSIPAAPWCLRPALAPRCLQPRFLPAPSLAPWRILPTPPRVPTPPLVLWRILPTVPWCLAAAGPATSQRILIEPATVPRCLTPVPPPTLGRTLLAPPTPS